MKKYAGELQGVTSVVTFMASKIPQAQQVMTTAVDAISIPLVWIKDNVLPPLTTAFQAVWNFGVSAFNNTKNAVLANMGAFSGILTILDGVKNALFVAFEFCKPALNWVKDNGLPLIVNALAGVVQGATAVFNFFVNNWNLIAPVIAGINGLINGINEVTGAVGIPSIPTFTAPQIPMLAKGGMIRTAGSVIVGEKGPEILSLPQGAKVTPIDKSTKRTENKWIINIYADGKSVDEILDELVPRLKLAIENM